MAIVRFRLVYMNLQHERADCRFILILALTKAGLTSPETLKRT